MFTGLTSQSKSGILVAIQKKNGISEHLGIVTLVWYKVLQTGKGISNIGGVSISVTAAMSRQRHHRPQNCWI